MARIPAFGAKDHPLNGPVSGGKTPAPPMPKAEAKVKVKSKAKKPRKRPTRKGK
jgi:hypothetical protein